MQPRISTAGPLAGRVALVVEGGRGVAATVALALSAAGASLALLAPESCEVLTVATLARTQGVKALGLTANLDDADSVAEALATLQETLGPITILVHRRTDDAIAQVIVPELQAAGAMSRLIILAPSDPATAAAALAGRPPPVGVVLSGDLTPDALAQWTRAICGEDGVRWHGMSITPAMIAE